MVEHIEVVGSGMIGFVELCWLQIKWYISLGTFDIFYSTDHYYPIIWMQVDLWMGMGYIIEQWSMIDAGHIYGICCVKSVNIYIFTFSRVFIKFLYQKYSESLAIKSVCRFDYFQSRNEI
jgi:hypothetical protein